MKKVTVCSNMRNEINQVEKWYACFSKIADGGMIIVDTFSTDGTFEFFQNKPNVIVLQNTIIQTEGYGPARTQLRELAKQHFPDSQWACYFDADESISEDEFHTFKWIKDYLTLDYDVVAFPRIDWFDREMTKAANDYRYSPDWQARMSRLGSPIQYVRKLHEQVTGHKSIYCNLSTPKINHFHRDASVKEKRSGLGKLCAKLHMEDEIYGATYPEHESEQKYRELYLKEGL